MDDSPDYAPLSPLAEGSADHHQEPSEYLSHPHENAGNRSLVKIRRRPFDFWQWEGFGLYLEFLAGLIMILGILQLVLGRWTW